jgi:hypothetical protein
MGTMNDVRRTTNDARCTRERVVLRSGVVDSLIPVEGVVLRVRSQITGAAGRYRRSEMSDEGRQMAVAANPVCAAFRSHVICQTARISRNRAGKSRKSRRTRPGVVGPIVGPEVGPVVRPIPRPAVQPVVRPVVGRCAGPAIPSATGQTARPIARPAVPRAIRAAVGPIVEGMIGWIARPVVGAAVAPMAGPAVGRVVRPAVAPAIGRAIRSAVRPAVCSTTWPSRPHVVGVLRPGLAGRRT